MKAIFDGLVTPEEPPHDLRHLPFYALLTLFARSGEQTTLTHVHNLRIYMHVLNSIPKKLNYLNAVQNIVIDTARFSDSDRPFVTAFSYNPHTDAVLALAISLKTSGNFDANNLEKLAVQFDPINLVNTPVEKLLGSSVKAFVAVSAVMPRATANLVVDTFFAGDSSQAPKINIVSPYLQFLLTDTSQSRNLVPIHSNFNSFLPPVGVLTKSQHQQIQLANNAMRLMQGIANRHLPALKFSH